MVWKKLEMKTMKDYDNLYLKCDVLLLADVSEKFRNNSIKNYGFCPSHYLSAPGLIWDAMLNMTKGKLELISDPDMYIFVEHAVYGKKMENLRERIDVKLISVNVLIPL